MPNDALDPGPDGTYPHWPRDAAGVPDPERVPSGETVHRRARDGRRFLIDQTQADPTGAPIVPPTIPPTGGEE